MPCTLAVSRKCPAERRRRAYLTSLCYFHSTCVIPTAEGVASVVLAFPVCMLAVNPTTHRGARPLLCLTFTFKHASILLAVHVLRQMSRRCCGRHTTTTAFHVAATNYLHRERRVQTTALPPTGNKHNKSASIALHERLSCATLLILPPGGASLHLAHAAAA